MHGATIWLELAERARTRADDMLDPAERLAALAIVADYETQDSRMPRRRVRVVLRCLHLAGM